MGERMINEYAYYINTLRLCQHGFRYNLALYPTRTGKLFLFFGFLGGCG